MTIIKNKNVDVKKRRKSDDGLREVFMKIVRKAGGQATPIETGAIVAGVPDMEYCFSDGTSGWVECKATQHNQVLIKPLQVSWLTQRSRLGGRCFIAVRRRDKKRDELFLFLGDGAKTLKAGGLEAAEAGYVVGYWEGGPSRWSYEELIRLLKV